MLQELIEFLDQGGPVLWLLFGTCFLLWFFILERFWFVRIIFPTRWQQLEDQWRQSKTISPQWVSVYRKTTLSECSLELSQNLGLIKTLVVICPLLGLLGTVTGMVAVFDVIAEACW